MKKTKRNYVIIVLLIIGLLSMTFVLCFFNNSLLYIISTSVYRLMSNCSNPLLTELIFDSLSSNKDTFNFGYTIKSGNEDIVRQALADGSLTIQELKRAVAHLLPVVFQSDRYEL